VVGGPQRRVVTEVQRRRHVRPAHCARNHRQPHPAGSGTPPTTHTLRTATVVAALERAALCFCDSLLQDRGGREGVGGVLVGCRLPRHSQASVLGRDDALLGADVCHFHPRLHGRGAPCIVARALRFHGAQTSPWLRLGQITR